MFIFVKFPFFVCPVLCFYANGRKENHSRPRFTFRACSRKIASFPLAIRHGVLKKQPSFHGQN